MVFPPQGTGGIGVAVADTRTATIVVAASNSLDPTLAPAAYRCDGVDDHVEIQAALDALPATGGQVVLLDGTFNCEATCGRNISNVAVRGQGNSTILTTSTADLTFLSFVGASGTELTGITIADMQIDGANVSDHGIYFEYVDKSLIQNVYSRRHASGTGIRLTGIVLTSSDFNRIIGNTCSENTYNGIYLYSNSNNNIITGNTCQGNTDCGIYLYPSNNNTVTGNTCSENTNNGISLYINSNNTVTGNTCQGNGGCGIYLYSNSNNTITGNTCQGNSYHGIFLFSSNNNTVTGNTCSENEGEGIRLCNSNSNTVTGNTCSGNGYEGIYLFSSNNNTVTGNTCIANSQESTNSYDDICVINDSNYNNIQGNTCRAGTLANVPQYGINIASADCDGNVVTNNDLYNDGFGTGSFNDSGTLTVTAAGNRT